MSLLTLIVAGVWGSLLAQFSVQIFTSLLSALIAFPATLWSQVDKRFTVMGVVTGLAQAIVFLALILVGHWIISKYILFEFWNWPTIIATLTFAFTLIYALIQVPGVLILNKTTVWSPGFAEESLGMTKAQRLSAAMRRQFAR